MRRPGDSSPDRDGRVVLCNDDVNAFHHEAARLVLARAHLAAVPVDTAGEL